MTRRMLWVGLFVSMGSALIGAVGQTQALSADMLPEFEAASIKVNRVPEFVQKPRRSFTPGRFTARNMTLRGLAEIAFDMASPSQLVGGPRWLDSASFDVEAVASGASNDKIRLSLQRLLIERFSMVVSREERVLPVYKLVRARSDGRVTGLVPSACDPMESAKAKVLCGGMSAGASKFQGYSITMARFASSVTPLTSLTGIDRLVVDETGLSGTYDFKVEFTPAQEPYGLRYIPRDDLPGFATALTEQLGLKLQPARHPTKVIVVQSASMPTAN